MYSSNVTQNKQKNFGKQNKIFMHDKTDFQNEKKNKEMKLKFN